MDFRLSVAPEVMEMLDAGTFNKTDKAFISSSLALPFSGGALSLASIRLRHSLYPLGTFVSFAPGDTSRSMMVPSDET